MQCFCSRAVDDLAEQGEPIGCEFADVPCTGDATEFCGGSLVISVYEVREPVLTGPSYGGCYVDNVDNRVLSGAYLAEDALMTPEVCTSVVSTCNGVIRRS